MKTFLIAAITLDGFIGKDETDTSTRWTSPEDASWFSHKTKQARFCVMGRKTYETFNQPLPGRVVLVQTKDTLTWQQKQADLGTKVKIVDNQTDLKTLENDGRTQVWATNLEIDRLHQLLVDTGVKELAVCGGASIYTQWLLSGLVDELYLTVEPIIFGAGVKLFNQPVELRFKIVEEKRLNDHGTRLIKLIIES